MGKITFIIGGARSGKSRQAQKICRCAYRKVAYIATCMPLDDEMKHRVKMHKQSRPAAWKTFEDPKNIPELLNKIGWEFEVVLIDCLTLWVSNFVMKGLQDRAIEAMARKLMRVLKEIKSDVVLVSNEVGLGIVPENKLARDFRDSAGKVNQITAQAADEVYFMVAGLPWKLK